MANPVSHARAGWRAYAAVSAVVALLVLSLLFVGAAAPVLG